MNLSGIPIFLAGNLLVSYSCSNCWNFQGRGQGDFSHCHSSDIIHEFLLYGIQRVLPICQFFKKPLHNTLGRWYRIVQLKLNIILLTNVTPINSMKKKKEVKIKIKKPLQILYTLKSLLKYLLFWLLSNSSSRISSCHLYF